MAQFFVERSTADGTGAQACLTIVDLAEYDPDHAKVAVFNQPSLVRNNRHSRS